MKIYKYIIILSLSFNSCSIEDHNNNNGNKCVYKKLSSETISKMDSTYKNAHFADLLYVIPKDSLCKDMNTYSVLIARVYGKDKKSIICRLLDNKTNWQALSLDSLIKHTKIIEYNLRHEIYKELNIYTADSTKLQKQHLPTIIVEAKLVQM